MRKALLLAILLVLLAFAGCLDDGPKAQGQGDGDGPRTSDGGRTSAGGNHTDPPHDTISLLDGDVSLVGPGSQSFDVQVPDNVTIVDFDIVSQGPATELVSLRVELEGCGVHDMGQGSSSGSFGGSMSYGDRLCNDATGGQRTATISNSGVLQGKLKLTGQVPKAVENATA